jgi:hypothetical protein
LITDEANDFFSMYPILPVTLSLWQKWVPENCLRVNSRKCGNLDISQSYRPPSLLLG